MIRCTNCTANLPDESLNSQRFVPCPICQSFIRADVFPAAYKTLSGGTSGELLLMDDESSCFYHPKKQAVTTCSYCGRFLCSLCDVDFNNQHFCTSCLESGKKKGKINKLENSRIQYDNLVLGLAIFPIFTVYFPILTAPATIFLVIRYWKKPSGIIKRNKFRMILALLIAGLQIAGLSILGYIIFTRNIFSF